MRLHTCSPVPSDVSVPLPAFTIAFDHEKEMNSSQEAINEPELIKDAPHSTRLSRLDETAAARKPILRWKPEAK